MNLLLEGGHVINPHAEADKLRERLDTAREDLTRVQEQLDAERRKNRLVEESVVEIKRQLQPLHLALKGLFGEIDSLPLPNNPSSTVAPGEQPANPKRAIWDKWVERFGRESLNARFIIALLEHGEMTSPQLRVVMQCAQNSVGNTATRLKGLGLITKVGSKYSLKEL